MSPSGPSGPLVCVYFYMCRQIAQLTLEFNTSKHCLIGDIFLVTKGLAKGAVI